MPLTKEQNDNAKYQAKHRKSKQGDIKYNYNESMRKLNKLDTPSCRRQYAEKNRYKYEHLTDDDVTEFINSAKVPDEDVKVVEVESKVVRTIVKQVQVLKTDDEKKEPYVEVKLEKKSSKRYIKIEKFRPDDVKDELIPKYVKVLNALCKGLSYNINLDYCRTNNADITNYIENRDYSKNSIKMFYLALDKYTKGTSVNEFYHNKYLEWFKIIKNNINEATDSDRKIIIDLEDFKKKSIGMKGRLSPVESILCYLYAFIPPRRLKDYYLMKVSNKTAGRDIDKLDKDFNYCVVSKTYRQFNKLVFNNYKTSDTAGQYVNELKADETEKVARRSILNYIKLMKVKDGSFLFSKNGEGYNQSEFSKLCSDAFTKVAGIHLTVVDMRSNYATSTDLNDRVNVNKVVKDMGTGHGTFFNTYRKQL